MGGQRRDRLKTEELAKKQLVWKMLWSRYCHVRAKSPCEAKLLQDIADVMGKMGSEINHAQYLIHSMNCAPNDVRTRIEPIDA